MHTEKRDDPNTEFNYEVRDINAPAIWKSTIYFFGFALASIVIGALVFWSMNQKGLQPVVNEASIARDRVQLAKNVPVVQSNIAAKTDLMTMRHQEEKKLHGVPTQGDNGKFTIPIKAAMKMVAETGGKSRTVSASDFKVGTGAGDHPSPVDVTISNGVPPTRTQTPTPNTEHGTPTPAGGTP